jgi:hypothetical protein
MGGYTSKCEKSKNHCTLLDSQGVSGYADELARTVRVHREKLGDHVQVVAMPPVLLGGGGRGGVNSPRLVRNLIETEY